MKEFFYGQNVSIRGLEGLLLPHRSSFSNIALQLFKPTLVGVDRFSGQFLIQPDTAILYFPEKRELLDMEFVLEGSEAIHENYIAVQNIIHPVKLHAWLQRANEMREIIYDYMPTRLFYGINNGFPWEETPEGKEFWIRFLYKSGDRITLEDIATLEDNGITIKPLVIRLVQEEKRIII